MSTLLSVLFMLFSFLVGYLGWGMHTGLVLLAVATGISLFVNLATDSVFGFLLSVCLLIPGLLFLIGFLIWGLQGGLIAVAVAIGLVLWIVAARHFFKDLHW